MKARVDPELCNGCGPCVEVCPEVFEVIDNTAVVKADPVPAAAESACLQAAINCPADAISIEG